MRLSILTAAIVAATALAGAASSASAQRVGVEIYAGPSAYYDDDGYAAPAYGYGPRVYADEETVVDTPEVVVRTPRRSGGCGEFFYWNGVRCIDARTNPPDLH
jgi:hypothetical protein